VAVRWEVAPWAAALVPWAAPAMVDHPAVAFLVANLDSQVVISCLDLEVVAAVALVLVANFSVDLAVGLVAVLAVRPAQASVVVEAALAAVVAKARVAGKAKSLDSCPGQAASHLAISSTWTWEAWVAVLEVAAHMLERASSLAAAMVGHSRAAPDSVAAEACQAAGHHPCRVGLEDQTAVAEEREAEEAHPRTLVAAVARVPQVVLDGVVDSLELEHRSLRG